MRAAKQNADQRVGELRALFVSENMAGLEEFTHKQLYQAIDPVTEVIGKLTAYQLKAAQESREQGALLFAKLQGWMIAVSLFMTALGAAMVTLVAYAIRRKLNAALGLAERVAAGDLDAHAEAKGNDEINALIDKLNEMSDTLRRIVGEVMHAASSVAASSQELSASAEQLSQARQSRLPRRRRPLPRWRRWPRT